MWFEEDETATSVTVREAVFTMCEALDRVCNELVPLFVGPEYAFDFRVFPLHRWQREGRISIGLNPLGRGGDRFPLEDLATGYQLASEPHAAERRDRPLTGAAGTGLPGGADGGGPRWPSAGADHDLPGGVAD